MEGCLVCGTLTKRYCSRCQVAAYCSQACQSTHWKSRHQYECIEGKRDRDAPPTDKPSRVVKGARVDHLLIAIENDDVATAEQLLESRLYRPSHMEHSKSLRMANMLRKYGANPYEYIGNGRVVVDELRKRFPIYTLLNEYHEETPLRVVQILAKGRSMVTLRNTDPIYFKAHTIKEFRHLIFNGMFPTYDYHNILIEDILFRRYDSATLEFWTGHGEERWISSFSEWRYINLAHRPKDIDVFFASLLLLYAPSLFYRESRRPITDMNLFLQHDPQIMHRDDILKSDHYIFVTRYGKKRDTGLFFGKSSKEYCGTFYYYEPESSVALYFNRALRVTDKLAAAKSLGVNLPSKVTVIDIDDRNLLLTPNEALEYPGVEEWKFEERSLKGVDLTRRYYIGAGYAGAQSNLDQYICEAAAKQGYDIVILEKIPGPYQIDTEVLDARPREESFRNLVSVD